MTGEGSWPLEDEPLGARRDKLFVYVLQLAALSLPPRRPETLKADLLLFYNAGEKIFNESSFFYVVSFPGSTRFSGFITLEAGKVILVMSLLGILENPLTSDINTAAAYGMD